MKFITAEQFGKADKKVRDSIMQWWEPREYDLACYYGITMLNSLILKPGVESVKKVFIPLLTVGQLIEFIEWKLGGDIDIYRAGMKGHQISTEWRHDIQGSKYVFRNDKHNLLKSLWEVAQKVCE